MDANTLRNLYGRARINDRQVNELIGLSHGLIADGTVNQKEAEYLYKWLIANKEATDNPLISMLFQRVDECLRDGKLDSDEANDLFETLSALSGGDYEVGEAQKATSLPFCKPAPPVEFANRQFCFTGTFGFGSRAQCESVVTELGGKAGSLTKATNFLVIGIYATDSWAHSSYGRKIEKGVELREAFRTLSIISEEHWVHAFRR